MKFGKRIVALFVAVALCGVSLPARAAQASVSALFINVGKADAALYRLADKNYLIDTGAKESADALMSALNAYRVDRLDGVILTHTDNDHVGGLKTLLKSDIVVERLYAPVCSVYKEKKNPVLKASEKYGVPMTWVEAGGEIRVSDDIAFRALGPLRLDSDNENNNSLVLRLVTTEGDMLLVGDMEQEEELDLLAEDLIEQALVLKVGHHGKNDASKKAFLLMARPSVAIISTSSAEDPNTPNGEVLGRLATIGAETFVTGTATCGYLVTLSGGVATVDRIDYTK